MRHVWYVVLTVSFLSSPSWHGSFIWAICRYLLLNSFFLFSNATFSSNTFGNISFKQNKQHSSHLNILSTWYEFLISVCTCLGLLQPPPSTNCSSTYPKSFLSNKEYHRWHQSKSLCSWWHAKFLAQRSLSSIGFPLSVKGEAMMPNF